MTMSVKTEPQKTTGPQECAGCGKKIQDRYLLKALDLYWHEDCLKCGCCDCRLGEVGSTLYTKGNLILCKRDYLRLFGTTGYCAACNKVIPAFEMVMRAKTNVYHLECFACQQCNHRFCVGDRFFLCDNKILCEYDYEERMVFANLAYSSPNIPPMKGQPNRPTNGIKDLPNGPNSTTSSGMPGGQPPIMSPPNGMLPMPPPPPPPPHMNGHHPMAGGGGGGGEMHAGPPPHHPHLMHPPMPPRPPMPMPNGVGCGPQMSSSASMSMCPSSLSSSTPLPPMSSVTSSSASSAPSVPPQGHTSLPPMVS